MKHLTEAEREIEDSVDKQSGNLGDPVRVTLWSGDARYLLTTISELRETIAGESNAWFHVSSMTVERDQLREKCEGLTAALKTADTQLDKGLVVKAIGTLREALAGEGG